MNYKFSVSVRDNRNKYVTFNKKIAKSVTFCLVSSILLEHIWTNRLFISKNLWWLLQRKKFIAKYMILLLLQKLFKCYFTLSHNSGGIKKFTGLW